MSLALVDHGPTGRGSGQGDLADRPTSLVGIENPAINEKHAYDLEHCGCHESVAMEVWLLIRLFGFVLFELYARLHCQMVRLGAHTLGDLRDGLFLALGRWEGLAPLWSG